MIQFLSIAGHLQIKIAEQIRYFDQLQFALSSKHGGDVLKLTKHKPVLEIQTLTIKDEFKNVIFSYVNASNFYHQIEKNWSELSQLPVLPRFKVSTLVPCGVTSDILTELGEKAVFVPSGVILRWFLTERSDDVFLKLSEMFHLKGFCSNGTNDLFSLSAFREIRNIRLEAENTPDDLLLLLQATKICLIQQTLDRSVITANLFFQQWFEKKRNLEWFQMRCYERQRGIEGFREDIIFSGVPFTFIWKSKEDGFKKGCPKNIKFRKAISEITFEELETKRPLYESLYSIDRGDKKLLVFYNTFHGCLIAQEYTNVDDIIEIC